MRVAPENKAVTAPTESKDRGPFTPAEFLARAAPSPTRPVVEVPAAVVEAGLAADQAAAAYDELAAKGAQVQAKLDRIHRGPATPAAERESQRLRETLDAIAEELVNGVGEDLRRARGRYNNLLVAEQNRRRVAELDEAYAAQQSREDGTVASRRARLDQLLREV